jgi:hypothetical protein
MGNRIDWLFQEWYRIGGAVLLDKADPSVQPIRPPEEVMVESTRYCRESGRLTWVVLDWFINHIHELDEAAIRQKTAEQGDLSVLGVLCDAASQRNSHPAFLRIKEICVPHDMLEPFFHRVKRSSLASRLAHEQGLDIFRRWNYLCNELRYLSDETGRNQVQQNPKEGYALSQTGVDVR